MGLTPAAASGQPQPAWPSRASPGWWRWASSWPSQLAFLLCLSFLLLLLTFLILLLSLLPGQAQDPSPSPRWAWGVSGRGRGPLQFHRGKISWSAIVVKLNFYSYRGSFQCIQQCLAELWSWVVTLPACWEVLDLSSLSFPPPPMKTVALKHVK